MTVPYSRRMQGYGSDFIKEMFAAARNPDLISFAGGAPAPELYPLEQFRASSDKAFDTWGRTMMAYDRQPPHGAQPRPAARNHCR